MQCAGISISLVGYIDGSGGSRQTVFVVFPVPVRVAGDVLGFLVLLLRVRLEHLLKELELGCCEGEEEGEKEEDREEG